MVKQKKDFENTNNIYQEYEIRKGRLPSDLTPEQYEIAIAEIVEDLEI